MEVQVSKLEKSGFKWSQHNYYYYDDESQSVVNKINTYKYRDSYEYSQFCSFKVQTSCFMVDREAVILNDCYFDEKKTFGEDTEFYLKMMKLFPLLCIDCYLGYFRIRGSNAGKDLKKQIKSRAVFWKEHQEDNYVRKHISKKVVFAYSWCLLIDKEKILSSCYVAKLAYCIPWLIFKIESWKLEKRSK